MIPPWGGQRFEPRVECTFDIKPDTLERVEVIMGVCRRRRWPPEAKARVVMESLEKGAIISEVARHHGSRRQKLLWNEMFGEHVITSLLHKRGYAWETLAWAVSDGSPFRKCVFFRF